MNLLIPTPYGNLFATHIPIVKDGFFKENNVKIFIHGHTHRRKYALEDGVIVINPGAITFPHDQYDLSYAILEVSKEKVEVVFYTLDE